MEDSITPPTPRIHRKRLPEKVRTLEPNQWVLCPDMATVRCVRAYGKYRGWRMVQKQEPKGIRVWRLEDTAK